MRKKNNFYIVGILIVFFILIPVFFLSAPKDFPKDTVINVKQGSNLGYIAEDLKINNLIRSGFVFKSLVFILGGDKNIQFGDYLFENKLSVLQIAWRISKGEHHLPRVEVTIPEGFNIFDISNLFVTKLTNFNKDKFLIFAMGKEGYLFPDTYFFLTTDTEQQVFKSMSDNFAKKIADLKSEIISFGKTEKEIIIMASIIEKESKGDDDREFISGILWKRLAINMPLQVDAEPNTYKTRGLPKNPISNPGLEAIKSAIHPKNSPYLYYLHDKSGNIHYAKTFTEHQMNIRKYLR